MDEQLHNYDDIIEMINILKTADCGMQEIEVMLNRALELATIAAEDTTADSTDSRLNRESLQSELDVLVAQIDKIAHNTKYKDMPLLDGSFRNGAISKYLKY